MDLREQLEQALAKARKDRLLAGLAKDAPGEPPRGEARGGEPAGSAREAGAAAITPAPAIRAWKCGSCDRIHRSVFPLGHCSACGARPLLPVCPQHGILLGEDGGCSRCKATAGADGIVERWERRQAERRGEARAPEPPPMETPRAPPPPAPAAPAWKCADCGQIHQAPTRPEYCPDCGSAQVRPACARHGVFADTGCPQCRAEEEARLWAARWEERRAERRRLTAAREDVDEPRVGPEPPRSEAAPRPAEEPAPRRLEEEWRRLVRGFLVYAVLVALAIAGALVYENWSAVSDGEKLLAEGKPKEALEKLRESYVFFRDRREEGIRHAQAQITLASAQQLFAQKKIPEALQQLALVEKDLARPEAAQGLRAEIRRTWLDGLQRLAKEEMYEAALAEIQGLAPASPDLAEEGRAVLKQDCLKKLGALEADPARFPQALQHAARLKMIYPEESTRAADRIARRWLEYIERGLLPQRKFQEAAESARSLQNALPASGQVAAQTVRAAWMREAKNLTSAGKFEEALAEAGKMEPFFAEVGTIKEDVRESWTRGVNLQLDRKLYPEAAREAERLRAAFEAHSKVLREKVERDWVAAARALTPQDGVVMSRKLAEFFPATGGQLEPELVAAWQRAVAALAEGGDLRRAFAESQAMEKLKLTDPARAVRDLILAKVQLANGQELPTYTYVLRDGRRITARLLSDLGGVLAIKHPDGRTELLPRAEVLSSVRQPGTSWVRPP